MCNFTSSYTKKDILKCTRTFFFYANAGIFLDVWCLVRKNQGGSYLPRVIVILLRCCDRICCKSRESRESRCLGPIKFLRMVSGSMHKATQLSVPFLLVLSVCQGAEHVGFTKDVLPVFQRHCFECHGPDVQLSLIHI